MKPEGSCYIINPIITLFHSPGAASAKQSDFLPPCILLLPRRFFFGRGTDEPKPCHSPGGPASASLNPLSLLPVPPACNWERGGVYVEIKQLLPGSVWFPRLSPDSLGSGRHRGGWLLGCLSRRSWREMPLASGAEGGQRLLSTRHQLFIYFLLFPCYQKKKKKEVYLPKQGGLGRKRTWCHHC